MIGLFNQFINAVLIVSIATLIPFAVYYAKHKNNKGFFQYIGLFQTDMKETLRHALIALAIVFSMAIPYMLLLDSNITSSAYTVSGKLKIQGLSVQSIISLLLYALIETSLWEEIFFRGFLGKQLSHKFGFAIGNTTQALVFGIIHTLIPGIGLMNMIILFTFTSINGFLSGYLVEKSNGSIIASWISHAVGNIIAFSLTAFVG